MTRENFPAATATAEAQDRCDAWNQQFPNGAEVRYRDDVAEVRTRTTSPAMVIGRTASIHVAFLRDPIALADVRPVTSEEVGR